MYGSGVRINDAVIIKVRSKMVVRGKLVTARSVFYAAALGTTVLSTVVLPTVITTVLTTATTASVFVWPLVCNG